MATRSEEAPTGNVDGSLSACSPNAWAKMVFQAQSISADDPPAQKATTLRNFGIQEHTFSAGPDLTLEDYLRLRVLWHSWPDQTSFGAYTPGNSPALNGHSENTRQTEYISPENNRIADAIFNGLKPTIDGYLQDIRRVGNGDPTRPSSHLTGDILYDVRYKQGLLLIKTWHEYDEDDRKLYFRDKVRKTEASLPQGGDGSPARDSFDVECAKISDQFSVDMCLSTMLQAITFLAFGARKGASPDLTADLSQAGGLKHLDWLPFSQLLAHLTIASSESASPRQLIAARTDGYLCRRDFVRTSDNDDELKPNSNRFPLAILDNKPFPRQSALPACRWQESAEIAAFVSELDDRYEKVGLLHSSPSGMKRRLLISHARHDLWIIIAEYGDQWKQYVRGIKQVTPGDVSQPRGLKDNVGTEGTVSAKETDQQLDLLGPEHFCTMHEWGPYNLSNADHMDCFIRRMIGFEVELAQNWPVEEFEHPWPEPRPLRRTDSSGSCSVGLSDSASDSAWCGDCGFW